MNEACNVVYSISWLKDAHVQILVILDSIGSQVASFLHNILLSIILKICVNR